MAIFGAKPWVIPFEKCQFFDFLNFQFLQPRKAFFWLQNIVKDIFLVYIKQKINLGKIAILGPKPWVITFRKMSILRLFKRVVLIAQTDIFWFQNIVKIFSWLKLAKKKQLEKWPFLDQNHGLTPLEKCHFFDFLNFLFLQPRKAFFRSRIS